MKNKRILAQAFLSGSNLRVKDRVLPKGKTFPFTVPCEERYFQQLVIKLMLSCPLSNWSETSLSSIVNMRNTLKFVHDCT